MCGASPLYKRPEATNIMQYAQHIHVVKLPVHSLYYITSYTKKYGSGQPNTDIKLPHLLQETGAISKVGPAHNVSSLL